MIEVEQSDEIRIVRTGRVQLAFRYRGDRWQHEILLRGNTGWESLLASIEGTADNAVPPSPVFQDLRLEAIDELTREFQLFGQAGKGIYSAAVRVNGAAHSISFDIAARAQRDGVVLCTQSHYGTSVAAAFDCRTALSIGNGDTRLKISATLGSVAIVPCLGETTIDSGTVAAGILASDGSESSTPRSVRWSYCVEVASR